MNNSEERKTDKHLPNQDDKPHILFLNSDTDGKQRTVTESIINLINISHAVEYTLTSNSPGL